MFCPKCGEKNKENAQFCVKCGKKFESEKEKSKKTSKVTAEDVKETAKEVTKEMTSEASSIIKDMIVKPVDTLKKYGEEKRFNLALVLVGIMSILVGLFGMALLKSVSAALNELVSSLYGGLLGMGHNMYGTTPELPYAKTFFYSLIATYALSFVFVGILYLVNNLIFKGKESFKKMYVIYGIISIVISAALLASTILSFVSIKLAALVLSLGLALSSFYIFHMIRLIGPKDENKHGYIYVITTVFFYLAVYIIAKIFM